VTGIVRGSEAAKLQFPVGSIIAKINEISTQGKRESEVRKLLFSTGSDVLLIGANPPGWPSIIDVQLPRIGHFVAEHDAADEFDHYCDGWSEKAFDEEHCCAKALHWVEANPQHLAEHRYEHDQVPIADDLLDPTIENFHADDFFQPQLDARERAVRPHDGAQSASWIQVARAPAPSSSAAAAATTTT
jgi:hypothetical protein